MVKLMKSGASAERMLPTANTAMRPSNSVRRLSRAESTAMIGAPTTTPSA